MAHFIQKQNPLINMHLRQQENMKEISAKLIDRGTILRSDIPRDIMVGGSIGDNAGEPSPDDDAVSISSGITIEHNV